jgi:predicted CXXCH cytochrome family protein
VLEGLSHPVGVVPTMSVPKELPLEEGRLTCTTCHFEMTHTGSGNGLMLREGATCGACHTAGSPLTRSHASSTVLAHPGGTKSGVSIPGDNLDGESVNCLACHDGTAAENAEPRTAADQREVPGHAGMLYRQITPDPSRGGLVEASHLDERVRLLDQRIQCSTCHSVYSRVNHLLVKDNTQSALCLSCHLR